MIVYKKEIITTDAHGYTLIYRAASTAVSNPLDFQPRPPKVQQQAETQPGRLQKKSRHSVLSPSSTASTTFNSTISDPSTTTPSDVTVTPHRRTTSNARLGNSCTNAFSWTFSRNPTRSVIKTRKRRPKPLGGPVHRAIISVRQWLKYLALPHASQPSPPQGHCSQSRSSDWPIPTCAAPNKSAAVSS